MGTTWMLVVRGCDDALLDAAEATIDDLERRWSRFRPDSEIAVLNRTPGVPVLVSPDTFQVIQAAVDGALATAVTLPAGVRLDLGGIGKGTAADLVSEQVMRGGAAGVAVSIGGDIRVRGESPSGGGWTFTDDGGGAIELPEVTDGGVCTSTRRRRWSTDHGDVHHIVDPGTGRPTRGAVESVTVMGATAQQAEVLTKAAMVAGDEAEAFLAPFGLPHVIRRRQVA